MRADFLCVVPLAVILGGCVVATRPAVVPATTMGFEEQYAPPLEFVVGGAPIYYDMEPGVAYYPIFLDAPGSCFCIVPMRYVNGVWLGVGGVVLYRGGFRFHHPSQYHRDVWLRSGGVINGYVPVRGNVERVGNAVRPVPPPGSVHAQHLDRQRAPGREQSNQSQQPPIRPQGNQLQQAPDRQQANQAQHAPDRQQPSQPQQAPGRQQLNQPQHAPDRQQPNQLQQAPNRQQVNQPQHAPDRQQPSQPQQAPGRQQLNQPQQAPSKQQASPSQQTPNRQQGNQQQQKKRQDERDSH